LAIFISPTQTLEAGQTHTPVLWQKTVNLKPELVEG